MRAVFNRNVPASFVLGEERVRSLVKILQKHAGKPSFEATGADNTTWSFENLEELFEYENAKRRRITSLDISSYAIDHEVGRASASINFTTAWWAEPRSYISVRVSGTEDQVSITMRALDEVATGCQPWHSWFSKQSQFVFWVMALTIAWIPFQMIEHPSHSHREQILEHIGIAAILGMAGRYVTHILFPSGVFLIGQEKARYKMKEWVQKLAIGTMVAAIITWSVTLFLRTLWSSL